MPFVLVLILQDALIPQADARWVFVTPFSSYITFMAGMIWIPIVLCLFIFIQYKYEPKYLKRFAAVLLALSIPLFMHGIYNYYYFDENGLHYNHLVTLNEITTYTWDDFQEFKKVFVKDSSNTSKLVSYEFVTNDQQVLTIPYRIEFFEFENSMLTKLKDNEVKILTEHRKYE